MGRENYAGARTLGTIEFMGETFRVVRMRINGKPWRKELILCHGNTAVGASAHLKGETDVVAATARFAELLRQRFKSRDALLPALQDILKRNGARR